MTYALVMVMVGLPVLSSFKSLMETIILLIFSTVGCWFIVCFVTLHLRSLVCLLFITLCQRFWLKFLLVTISL